MGAPVTPWTTCALAVLAVAVAVAPMAMGSDLALAVEGAHEQPVPFAGWAGPNRTVGRCRLVIGLLTDAHQARPPSQAPARLRCLHAPTPLFFARAHATRLHARACPRARPCAQLTSLPPPPPRPLACACCLLRCCGCLWQVDMSWSELPPGKRRPAEFNALREKFHKAKNTLSRVQTSFVCAALACLQKFVRLRGPERAAAVADVLAARPLLPRRKRPLL